MCVIPGVVFDLCDVSRRHLLLPARASSRHSTRTRHTHFSRPDFTFRDASSLFESFFGGRDPFESFFDEGVTRSHGARMGSMFDDDFFGGSRMRRTAAAAPRSSISLAPRRAGAGSSFGSMFDDMFDAHMDMSAGLGRGGGMQHFSSSSFSSSSSTGRRGGRSVSTSTSVTWRGGQKVTTTTRTVTQPDGTVETVVRCACLNPRAYVTASADGGVPYTDRGACGRCGRSWACTSNAWWRKLSRRRWLVRRAAVLITVLLCVALLFLSMFAPAHVVGVENC